MKLKVLHEERRRVEPTLNIFTSPEGDIRAAFDLMEHDGFYNYSMKSETVSLRSWHEQYAKKKERADDHRAEIDRVKAGGQSDTPEHFEDVGMNPEEVVQELEKEYQHQFGPGTICGGAIYGGGGWNRFFIRFDGGIWMSGGHAKYPKEETIQNAIDVGMGVF